MKHGYVHEQALAQHFSQLMSKSNAKMAMCSSEKPGTTTQSFNLPHGPLLPLLDKLLSVVRKESSFVSVEPQLH